MKKIFWLLVLWPLLTGCGISFYYNKLDWFANWYLDDFVELTDSQDKLFEKHFNSWHQWHRKTQLPLYYDQLKQLKLDIKQGINSQQILAHTHQARSHWLNLLEHIAPDVTRQLLTLSAEQKQELLDNIADELEEKANKFAEKSLKEQVDDTENRNIKTFKKWFGRLTDKQEQQIKTQLTKYQSSQTMWSNYRQNYLKQFEALLFNNQALDQFEKLADLLGYPDQMRSPELQQIIGLNQTLYAQFLSQFIAQASDTQKQHLYDEIDEYLQELEELIEQSAS